jgi:hypothetical protein
VKGIELDAPVGIALTVFALGVIAYCFSQYSEDVEGLQKLVREQQRQIADLTQQREILKKTLGIVCEGPSGN